MSGTSIDNMSIPAVYLQNVAVSKDQVESEEESQAEDEHTEDPGEVLWIHHKVTQEPGGEIGQAYYTDVQSRMALNI